MKYCMYILKNIMFINISQIINIAFIEIFIDMETVCSELAMITLKLKKSNKKKIMKFKN